MEQKPASSEDYGQPFDQVKETKLPIIPVPAKPLSLRPMTMSQNFGPIEAFFPKEASMAYEYFKSKSSFLQEYKFISFIAAMGISWIMTWEYDSAAYEECASIQYLRPAITASSTNNEQIAYKKETQFLAQKRQIMAALAAATSEEDIQNSLQAIQTVPLGEDEEVQSSPAHYYQDSQDPFEM
ncbi:Polyprotein [Arachis hypogaea]|nr:Polyprotein [Arachis hypogaea]